MIHQKCVSEDRTRKYSPQSGLEQTLALSMACSEGTMPTTVSEIRVL